MHPFFNIVSGHGIKTLLKSIFLMLEVYNVSEPFKQLISKEISNVQRNVYKQWKDS